MAANKTIWIIGDVYLTDAAAILTQMQSQDKDQLYLYQAYNVKIFYPKKLCTDTFGKVLRCTLYEGLNQHAKLPAVIIVVTGNKKIDDMVSTPFHTKRIWKTICTEFDRAIKARKNDLPKKAVLNEEPRIFFTNVFPRSKDHCNAVDSGSDSFKTKRRRLNNLLPQVLATFGFKVLNITGILPDDVENFVDSTGQLTSKGILIFWKSVSQELRAADEALKEKIKNNIIGVYLDEVKEQERLDRDRQVDRQDRFATPKPIPRRELNRGDFNAKRFDSGFQRPKIYKNHNRSRSLVR